MWYTLQNQELTTNLISGTSGTMRITKLARDAIVCEPDKINQKILVNGRVWRFDFDRCGSEPTEKQENARTPKKRSGRHFKNG
jgi:hypothetical protein